MKNPSERKSDRLGEIEQLLLAHPEGLKQVEIARRLDVSRSTITRYLPNLPGSVYIDDLDDNKWKVDRQAYLINVRFTLDEAMAIHLATRLLATRMERQNPHAASALRKLGIALDKLAPRISQHLRQSADTMDNPAQRQDPNFLHSLEIITQAWALQHQVHLWYWSEKGELKEHDFAPYFIEPYAIGQSIYAIGWANPPDALRTFKVERIKRIEKGEGMYEIPDSFDPAILLKDAWGIWYTGEEPVEVVLKFSQRVARRVKETRWHRSEQVTQMDDGKLLWRAWIAAPQEMVPWIRGWGSDVEVLEPEGLREELAADAFTLAEIYS
ncbi:MAG: WYL domain-containing protein [Chloroflexi bacterium]|nr:WYL domain-containing protein [Chloroflexota bacterium]